MAEGVAVFMLSKPLSRPEKTPRPNWPLTLLHIRDLIVWKPADPGGGPTTPLLRMAVKSASSFTDNGDIVQVGCSSVELFSVSRLQRVRT